MMRTLHIDTAVLTFVDVTRKNTLCGLRVEPDEAATPSALRALGRPEADEVLCEACKNALVDERLGGAAQPRRSVW